MIHREYSFRAAKPVYESGKDKELNHAIKIEAEVGKYNDLTLAVSGYTGYQVYINGEFVHYGPARAGRGYYKVDELNISAYLTKESNLISIVATGCYVSSFEWLKEPSFVIAELISGDDVIAYTGGDGWRAYSILEKITRVQRYSYQRAFAEVYDFDRCLRNEEIRLAVTENRKFIARDVSYPDFPREAVSSVLCCGSAGVFEPQSYYNKREIVNAGSTVDGFAVSDTETISIRDAQRIRLSKTENVGSIPKSLGKNEYISAAMKGNTTGLIETCVKCITDAELYLTFDEVQTNGEIDFTRNSTSNVVVYKLKGGETYNLITLEPYTFKYINAISLSGAIEIKYLGIIRTEFNESEIVKKLDRTKADGVIERIYDAACETFRQNTFDIYMDCPSRERAGWLCDSFFTARVERLMSGKSTVEKAFLSNFLMEENYRGIPDGMLPMCYPSDFKTPEYIPNWAMWYFVELKEYLERTGDTELVEAARGKAFRLANYFKKYENSDGLLEKLDGWIFVEWSMCNKLVQDVNYPTNMMYYRFLMTLSELYGNEEFKEKALKLKDVIREKSRNGLFFSDNSVYRDGELKLTGECTETCQYYAFFTGIANPNEDAELWETMVNDFGPERSETGKWKNIYPSNAFIGNYLRLELLSENGIYDKLLANIRGYFDYMAVRTGTLWEHDREGASCNHGFASHVLVWLDKLGYLI